MTMRVEWWETSRPIPYDNNPRDNDAAVEPLANSIREFGWQQPIVVDADGVILAGHTRLKAAERLGLETVPVVVASDLTPAQCAAYRLADNKTAELATWDFGLLSIELDGLQPDFDMADFGFDSSNWFENRGDSRKQDGNDEYNAFTEKFEVKKTTDDCYTPDLVYDAVADWVASEYGVDRGRFVRPFYPGGDYENEEYPEGCVVVDNPPFSILVHIIRFYIAHGVRFFLFAPTLTLFSGRNLDVCYIAADCDITYENGAKVDTSFITNLDRENIVRTAPTLNAAVMNADKRNREEMAKPVNLKYKYPPYVITAAMVSQWSNFGVDFRVPKGGGAADRRARCAEGIRQGDIRLRVPAFGVGQARSRKSQARSRKSQGARSSQGARRGRGGRTGRLGRVAALRTRMGDCEVVGWLTSRT